MTPSDARSELIERAAALVVDAFDDYNARFSDITRRARRRFLERDWDGHRVDARARIGLYDDCIAETIGRLEDCLSERLLSRGLWLGIHARYAELIAGRLDAELYKTFFNTLTRRLFKTRGVDAGMEFVALDIEPTEHITRPVPRAIHTCAEAPADAIGRLLSSSRLHYAGGHLNADAARIAERLQSDLGDDRLLSLEMLQVPFYRDRRAYLVGRVFGERSWRPCVIALVHRDDGIRADAVVTQRRQVSRLFGFTYSYFHADLPTVGDAVVFLRTLLPDKPIDELYTVIGRVKQGKTERYRHFFKHLAGTVGERMVEAEGKRGMVMVVFTLPSYPLVFKVVRDHFAKGKKIGREHVLSQYRLVFNHDRVGRLIDAQEYRHLAFERERFDAALLDELQRECARSVKVERDRVLVRHCFVQRRVRPLDLYLGEHDADERERMVRDYGLAIKDLARSNLFPGDLFVKNFGVTRSRRCVFYDYDEVSLVTDLRFRRVPEPRTEEQAMADEPWYTVEPGDTFPEHFARFLDLAPELRRTLADDHPELFDPEWWRRLQHELRNDPSRDVQPYPDEARLAPA
jgi:isocitrate dehydrogenase kinase/phosphatase